MVGGTDSSSNSSTYLNSLIPGAAVPPFVGTRTGSQGKESTGRHKDYGFRSHGWELAATGETQQKLNGDQSSIQDKHVSQRASLAAYKELHVLCSQRIEQADDLTQELNVKVTQSREG